MKSQQRQRGVALLAAILMVAVATILAAAIAFESAMSARRGVASLSFDGSVLVAQGAEALAAFALKEDSRTTDSIADPWAQPFEPTEVTPGVVLAASLEDLEDRFNLNSLITRDPRGEAPDAIDPDALAIFQRLLQMLELEPQWATKIADWIDRDDKPYDSEGLEDNGTTSQNPPYRVANTFITSTSELLALPDFGRERYLKLAPYVVALPPQARINVCDASPILLDAMIGHQEFSSDPAAFMENRKTKCWPSLQDYQLAADPEDWPKLANRLKETSNFFRLTSLITIGGTEFTLYSLLNREGESAQGKVRVLQRSFTPD